MKIMSKIVILSFSIAFMSCGQIDKNQESKVETNKLPEKSGVTDTLRDPNHQYYYADIDPKSFAMWILQDSIKPSDNYSTFRVMDSLDAVKFVDRKFYFNVFINILNKADGALSEATGLPALKYVENHTAEFLKLSSTLPKKDFESWSYTVGVEILLSSNEDPIKDAKDYFEKLKNNCSNCTIKEKKLLLQFNDILIQTITENR